MSETYEIPTPTLSTGQPSTLGNWLNLTIAFFGVDSPATAFWQDHIAKSLEEGNGGADEAVISDEGQTLNLLASLHFGRTE